MIWNIEPGVFSDGRADISNGIGTTAINWNILDTYYVESYLFNWASDFFIRKKIGGKYNRSKCVLLCGL
jgi:hypothetical protein